MKIAIGIPSTGMWHADFAMSLLNLVMTFHAEARVGNLNDELRVIHNRGSILPKQRREIVRSALDWGADYLLWIDSDHTFPNYLLTRLLRHKKDVVAINCVTKSTPASPTARLKSAEIMYGEPTFSVSGKGLEKVWRVGTGVMLVKADVYRTTGPDIFHMFYRAEVDNYQGEDWSMCEAMEDKGFEIFVDHDLSLEVGHIGFLNYKHDLVPESVMLEMQQAQLMSDN